MQRVADGGDSPATAAWRGCSFSSACSLASGWGELKADGAHASPNSLIFILFLTFPSRISFTDSVYRLSILFPKNTDTSSWHLHFPVT